MRDNQGASIHVQKRDLRDVDDKSLPGADLAA